MKPIDLPRGKNLVKEWWKFIYFCMAERAERKRKVWRKNLRPAVEISGEKIGNSEIEFSYNSCDGCVFRPVENCMEKRAKLEENPR